MNLMEVDMTTHNSTYVKVTTDNGEDYLCPVAALNSKSTLGDDELTSCVEQDVVQRYSGNIKIEADN